MADILHDFPIRAPISDVYRGVSTPGGLDAWWTARSSGEARVAEEYQLWFGPEYDWRARVVRADADCAFELLVTVALPDWVGTRVAFDLSPKTDGTLVRFAHLGWPEVSEHYRISCYCWAMYLRVLRRRLEFGEEVPYERRLDV